MKISNELKKIKEKPWYSPANIVLIAMFAALYVVFSKIIQISPTQSLRFSFAFLSIAFAAYFCGIEGAVIVAGLGDVLGSIIFPTGGAYYPGFTLTAVINGLIFGIALSKKYHPVKAVLGVLASQIFCTILMNSYWNTLLYTKSFTFKAYLTMIISRLPQSGIMTVISIVCLLLIFGFIDNKLMVNKE